MKRRKFFQTLTFGAFAMNTLSAFRSFTSALPEQDRLMPVLFVGHGSPMNGIEDTSFSRRWKQLAKEIPTPAAVLVVSAHWYTKGTRITAMEHPRTIHDFGGFPKELFAVKYPAPGHPALAKETAALLHSAHAELDHEWGLDHGTWTIVRHMYPDAKIPVLQLSIDYTKGPQYHYELARELYALRRKGVLIMGSGNLVHNLRLVAWDRLHDENYGYDWATTVNERFKQLMLEGDHRALINYTALGREALLAVPTPEHYLPLLYVLGLQGRGEQVGFFNDRAVGGSLTMTSVRVG